MEGIDVAESITGMQGRDAEETDAQEVGGHEAFLGVDNLCNIELCGDKDDVEAAGCEQPLELHQGCDVALQGKWKHEHMRLGGGGGGGHGSSTRETSAARSSRSPMPLLYN
ncbi:hypothetical protein L7F22_059307 [Adiantum nelumboides]|nr:hypothetical protein [Adiantum nelumboides]